MNALKKRATALLREQLEQYIVNEIFHCEDPDTIYSAILSVPEIGPFPIAGQAQCMPGDTFSIQDGKRIARKRALREAARILIRYKQCALVHQCLFKVYNDMLVEALR